MQFNSYDMLSMLTLLVSRIQKNQKNITVRSFKKIIPSRNPIWTVISDIPLSCASMLTMLVSRVKKNHEVLRSDDFKIVLSIWIVFGLFAVLVVYAFHVNYAHFQTREESRNITVR